MSITASSSGCLVEGDMMFAPGQSYGAIMGFHCHNKSTYLGKQTIFGTSGSMVDVLRITSLVQAMHLIVSNAVINRLFAFQI
jgi:hypothetical protein